MFSIYYLPFNIYIYILYLNQTGAIVKLKIESVKFKVDLNLKIIKIYNMKKVLFILLLILCFPVFAAEENRGYVGTPPGFYDDIDPNSLEDEDDLKTKNKSFSNEESPYKTYSENGVDIGYSEPAKPTKNYAEIYNNLEPADFSYLHNIDPDQYYDTKDATWSIYPLLRLNSAIYFKNQTIEPGYYLLTPREHKGKWYMLFKQNGVVAHIIPVYDRDYTPEKFYDQHIPKPKLTPSQKIHMGILNTVGKVKSSKRKEPVKSYLEVNDLENYFVSVIVYYGNHKYSTIFRTIRL